MLFERLENFIEQLRILKHLKEVFKNFKHCYSSHKGIMTKERVAIPKKTQRALLVECGHKCSIHLCNEKTALEFHHINGNPSDNRKSNLIVLCANHHALAQSGKIDRKALADYKRRLKLDKPQETLKETVEREGIDVIPENFFVKSVLDLGKKYMMWRYGKPTASIKRELAVLVSLAVLCFVPFFYVMLILKAQITVEWIYVSTGFLFLGAFLIIVLSVVVVRRCSKCHGYFGIHRVDSKEVDRKVIETKQDTRITPIYRNTYRCVYCGDTYTKNERGETEIIPKEDDK